MHSYAQEAYSQSTTVITDARHSGDLKQNNYEKSHDGQKITA